MDARIFLALFAFSLLWFLRSIGYEFVGFDDTRVLAGHPNPTKIPSSRASARSSSDIFRAKSRFS